jgi:valyl-tRNA synthetase
MGQDAPTSVHVAPWPQDEATCQVDAFGGGVDEEDERLGGLLVGLVAGVRQLKTQGQLGMGRPLYAIHVRADEALRQDLAAVSADLCATARADRLTWDAPTEGAHELASPTHSVQGQAIQIGIDPAPKPVRR